LPVATTQAAAVAQTMAARYVYRHAGAVQGLALWAAYPATTDDLSSQARIVQATLALLAAVAGAP